ncbi:serine/threonine protein kinase [Streptomyces galilaeus]|uniref:non-specific serine/threonine protein kinase n=1 Tax=Streptomyces bobili TaxID=67280 RepID=A0ABZ1RC81_9ACTN|nr:MULTISPECIES: serine/threonine-protein kinase [Streptomyces]QEU67656.1 serine/threonine protein kinase [Streptomyces galilaeus]GGW30593.1 serine/threonine protein kinase [Streptomyces galilaeus]
MSEAERAGASRQDKSARLLAGRYRLGDVLGRGGMGTVWRAEDETLGRTVAVKELRFPGNIDDEEKRRLITRTLREAKAIARIRNNSAVTVFDVVEEDDRPWIVMELVEGKSLAEVIREDGVLEPKRAAEVGLAILDVLRSAHREGILHRDVKPSNVLIAEDGRVVLTDFGIAQVEGDPSITSTGMLVGAPSYISPERARGHKPGPAADLWSLGGLLYAAVEGTPPYDKGSAIATLTAVMTEPLDEPKNAGPLRDVIYGLLTKDPVRRLDDAGARAKLNAVLHAPDRRETEAADATKVVPLPMQPDGPGSRAGSSASSSAGSSGGEAAEKLRGALRSVRKAAVAAGAATSAAAGRAKSSNAPGVSGGSGASGASRSLGTQEETRGGAATGAVTSAAAVAATKAEGTAAGRATTTAASASVPVSRSATGAAPGQGGANGGPAPRSSGWPVMTPPDLPPRPVPRAPLTDVVPKRTLVIIAVVVALAVLGTVLALTLGGGEDDPDGAKSGGGSQAVASDSAAADTKDDEDGGARADGSAPESAASGSASGSSSPSSTAAAGGAGSGTSGSGAGAAVTTHESKQGYTIGLPAGWKYQSTSAAGDRFAGPDGQKLLIGWTTTPKDDPVADWENQERSMKRSQYKRVRIEKVDYRGWNTADWEFTYSESGTAYRTIDRGFVVNDHLGHALMHTAKSAAWDGDLRVNTWKTFTETFTPKV